MQPKSLRDQWQNIVDHHGLWTAHNIRLPEGLWTIRETDEPMSRIRSRRYLQIIEDILRRPIGELRILDLGCLEGGFSIELGMHGAEVVGMDGRAANIAKAEFAKQALGLSRVSFLREDIRTLSPERHGRFDAILCCGVFYHLPSKDLLPFLRTLHSVCRGVGIIDTHISLEPEQSFDDEGERWNGRIFPEHPPESSPEEIEKRLWASLDPEDSFWLTEASLLQALHLVGFTTVHACLHPPVASTPEDRKTYVACAGKSVDVLAMSPRTIPTPFEFRHYEHGQDPLMKKKP